MSKEKLILGPWRAFNDHEERYIRLILGKYMLGYMVYLYSGGMTHYEGLWFHDRNKKFFASKEHAMEDLDNNLRNDFNATFLTQEQFDRLSVLI